jgi:integrase/recombinase XerD
MELEKLLASYRQWLAAAGRSAASIKDHTTKLTWFWRFLEDRGLAAQGRVDLLAIDRDTMADYQVFVFGLVSPHTEKKLACNTQINLLCYLTTFFKFLEQSGRIALNPSDVIKLPRQSRLLPPVMLTAEEMRRLLAAPDVGTVMGFRDRCILEVFWSSAPRLGELVRLSLDDLNLDGGLLTIREGKGDKERVLPLGRGACAWLGEYLKNVRPFLLKKERAACGNVFVSKFGRQMDKVGWMHKLDVYLRRTRIKRPFSSHGFRHMLATEMLKNGADLRHIQQMLGHENLTTTQRYLHVVKAELRRVHHDSHPKEKSPLSCVAYRGSIEDEEP